MADFVYTFSLKHTINEVTHALNHATAIRDALQKDTTLEQQNSLKQIIAVLSEAQTLLGEPSCPNGMLFTFTIDDNQLGIIGKAQG
jgi:hypothetical protein